MRELVTGARQKQLRWNELETPCFVIDAQGFVQNVDEFNTALRKRIPSSIVTYSVKTNSLPYLLGLAKEAGCYAEVVSADEYLLAKSVGFSVGNIVYNGPLKSRETFIDALVGGAYVNVETKRELTWLSDLPQGITPKLGIRVNVDLDEVSPDDASPTGGSSRFGFDVKNGEFQEALRAVRAQGLAVCGLHMHRTSATRSTDVYAHLSQYAMEVARAHGLDLSYVDMGGGYYGRMPGKPGYDDYAEALANNLELEWDKVTLIVEPGNALLASPVDYLTSVIDSKRIGAERLLICDGTRLDIDPFFHKSKYVYELIGVREDAPIQTQTLCGCTCLENDVITTIKDKEIEVGDRILFKWEGAYTMALTPNFIRFLPNVYAFDGETYQLVRRKWGVSEASQQSVMSAMPGADGYLFLNAGRRTTLLKNLKKSLGVSANVVAADNWCVAPALYGGDKYYLTPKISDPEYLDYVYRICEQENVKAVTTCIDPEIELLASHRGDFAARGVLALCPNKQTADLCFDKFKMFEYLVDQGIATVLTYDNLCSFKEGLAADEISLPVFIKPRTGSGSVGAERIDTLAELEDRFREPKYDYIIQELMDCEDCDADVYIDTISHKPVAALLKRKIETRIGGASKTIAFKDERLFDFIRQICTVLEFNGPVDMDFFYRDGVYYLSEVNPRFGGAYLHGFGAGVDFFKLIQNNISGIENPDQMGAYDEGSIMLMYDEVIMTHERDLLGDYND